MRICGPLSLADYMAYALTDRVAGYYMRRDPLGARGDFVTAPEISQMFGELVGLWCADVWRRMGAPGRVALAELGPGRGTLMRDALRAVRAAAPEFAAAVRVHFVDVSPVLRTMQARAAPGALLHGSVAALPRGPLLVIANEFLDALPVRQCIWQDGGWRERMVALDTTPGPQGGGCRIRFKMAASPRPCPCPASGGSAADGPTDGPADGPAGSIRESSPCARRMVADLASRLAAAPGAVLIADYGPASDTGMGDTLQAVRRHAATSALSAPGTADLTAHVRFADLARVAQRHGAQVAGPVTQGDFLRRLGIAARAARLGTPAATALERLTGAAQMGELFKVMALVSPLLAADAVRGLPGFAP